MALYWDGIPQLYVYRLPYYLSRNTSVISTDAITAANPVETGKNSLKKLNY